MAWTSFVSTTLSSYLLVLLGLTHIVKYNFYKLLNEVILPLFLVNGKYRSSVESFDFKENCWLPVTPMNQARAYSTAVSLDGNLYVIGGVYEKTDLHTVEKYDPSIEAWCQVASLQKCKGINY